MFSCSRLESCILFSVMHILMFESVLFCPIQGVYKYLSLGSKFLLNFCFPLSNFLILYISNQELHMTKKMLIPSTALIFISILIGLSEGALNQSLVHIIDQDEDSFIFRGNLPLDDNKDFQLQELKAVFEKKMGRPCQRIIVYSLLNFMTPKQTKNRYIEEKYFEDHNYDGKIHPGQQIPIQLKNFPVYGSFITPSDVPSSIRSIFTQFYDYTTLDSVNRIIDALNEDFSSPIPTAIYVHCSAGIDRTGLISGSYKMKNYNASLPSVMKQNLGIMKGLRGHMHFHTFNAIRWYCLSLGRSEEECYIDSEQPKYEQL